MKFKAFIWIVVGLGIMGATTLFIDAQRTEKDEVQKDVIAQVRENNLANIFYERILVQEPKWKFLYYSPPSAIQKTHKSVSFRFQNNNKDLRVYIRKYKDLDSAKAALRNPTNAVVKDYTKHGDEGNKKYDSNGFGNLTFRKGKFVVTVDCQNNEDLAVRVAGYAFESIS